MLINLIKIFIEGPEVSLNGSPTVSPVTLALCASQPLYSISPLITTPASKDFFALSHAPPALFWNIPIRTPETVTPASKPPRTSGPKANPTMTGVIKSDRAGKHHFSQGCLRRDGDAFVVFRFGFVFHNARNFFELTANFLHHRHRRAADCRDCQAMKR